MKNRGLTLVELIVVMIISGFVILMIVCQFVAQENFGAMISDQVYAENEAVVATRYMTSILRFAYPNSITLAYDTTFGYHYAMIVIATIQGGHIAGIPTDTVVSFGRMDDNSFRYCPNYPVGIANQLIKASDITSDFDVLWGDASHKDLIIKMPVKKNNGTCTLETRVYLAGGLL